jgi:integrase
MTQRQEGSLFASNGAWFVRYRERLKQPDGTIKTVQRAQRLASVKDFPKKSEVMALKHRFMAKINSMGLAPEAGMTLVDFVEQVYFPGISGRLAASTVKGYRDAWRCHIRGRVGKMRVRDFRTVDGENLMQDVERVHGAELAHGTYKWIKVSLSAIFTYARRRGAFDGANPVTGVSIPKGKTHGRKRLAYSLEEIYRHLELFEGAVKAAIGVAAFAGLREREIRGLWWEDDGGDILNIRRSVWRTIVKDDTKTHEDEEDPGVVPIIQPLRLMLDRIRPTAACGFMFPNTRNGSLDLDNLADRVIKPALQAKALAWKGWQAYRRGLATNLKKLGVPDTMIQAILRHENVSTTQRFYIKTARADVVDAMKRLEDTINCAASVQQASVN